MVLAFRLGMFKKLSIFICFSTLLFAQKSDLEKIKAEIGDLKEKFNQEINKEKDEFKKLNDLEGSISLSQELQDKILNSKIQLEKEIYADSGSIKQLKSDIEQYILKQNENQEIIKQIAKNLASRYRVLYKKRHQRSVLTVFDFVNFNQIMVKKKYFKIIKEQDQRNIDYYRQLKNESAQLTIKLENKRINLEKNISNLNQTVAEKSHLLEVEKKSLLDLAAKKEQKKHILNSIAKNKKQYLNQISEKEKAAREMEELMRRFEAERKQREEKKLAELAKKKKQKSKLPRNKILPKVKDMPETAFSDLKKHLIWPLTGKIIGRFGQITNQDTKTVTFNTGVEIQSDKNMRVQAVTSGEVIKIFWLRGYGNTIILEHGEGFYTVYSNLEKIYKTEGQKILAGEPIAVVDSNNGRLHFEVWHKKEKLNPEEWLKD